MNNSTMQNTLEYNTMKLSGKGQVTADPDIAILRLGVKTNNQNLTDAQTENAMISQNVLDTLNQLGITNIKTFQYNIDKIYEFENGKQIDKGYMVTNMLEIRINDLKQIGNVIDKSVSAGANIIDLIEFDISNIEPYYLEALNLAVMNAYTKARSISGILGILINPVPKQITENTTAPFPPRSFNLREGIAATPIEPGKKQIEANVMVEFIY
ncbi:SIMPL domain-containing protein [Anaerosacchariphilus polymeriproducens]|uniref:DUF541 domain-containing protein n=1 Tax=Anaerosacchariphilus polymeriproducens TaxID=1812858 RepID=A0A371AYS1_9FIRM|nr:SIMPL domain-containing protein [Anaerosacchariphilus polymeriproducens]RDU24706.1 DUF541 domain-containing protein [Anaerosacchariphilus polymeriproducens]